METRAEKRTIPAMFLINKTKPTKTNNSAKGDVIPLRRSARHLPAALKEVEEQKRNKEKEPDISTLPSINFEGKIKYVNTFADCAMTCDDLLQQVEHCQDDIVPLGFDIEWPFSFQTGSGKTALVQICMDDKICHLIHVYSIKVLPAAFVVLLSHPRVKLVGVNIKNDVWKLGRDFKEFTAQTIVENNCIDCGVFANKTLNRSCRWSMAKLTAYLLRKKISKDKAVRNSKWHIQPLSDKQKAYAATDAYVSLLLYTTIRNRADELFREESNGNHLDSQLSI